MKFLSQDISSALTSLQTGDFQTRWEIAKRIPTLGHQAIAPLVALLSDPDSDTELQWFVVRILGDFHHPEAVIALVNLLKTTEDEDLCLTAAQTLAQMGAAAIAALTPLLADVDTRLLAVQALAQIHHPQTLPALTQVVGDVNAEVRSAALEALTNFHHPSVPPLLLEALSDQNPQVRRAAIIGLSLHAGDLDPDLDLVGLIRPLLTDRDAQVCQQAALALGRLGSDAAAMALFQRWGTADLSPALLRTLVQALGWMGSSKALQCLQQMIQTQQATTEKRLPYLNIVPEIIAVMGRVKAPDAKPHAAKILLDLLASNDPVLQDPPVKPAIASALGQLSSPQAMPALIQLLAEPDIRIRLHAIAALKRLKSANPYRRLQTLANSQTVSKNLAEGVAIALKEW